jgi:hypothetical protein
MFRSSLRQGVHGLGLVVLAVCCAGCGKNRDLGRYVPEEARARQALEAALTAWQQGEPPGRVKSAPWPIEVVDSHRRPGQRLQRFEILGEVPGNARRCFAVKLALEKPREEKQVRFVVVGLEPLWVFRHEDYEMMAHWEHPMDEEGTARTAQPPKP